MNVQKLFSYDLMVGDIAHTISETIFVTAFSCLQRQNFVPNKILYCARYQRFQIFWVLLDEYSVKNSGCVTFFLLRTVSALECGTQSS